MSTLAEAIDAYDVAVDGDALREAFMLLDRLRAKVVAAVGSFDRAELWDLEHATSMTAWLRQHGRSTGRSAASTARLGRLVDGVTELREGWESGALSGGQVEVISANVSNSTRRLFVEQAAALLPKLARLTIRDTQLAMQVWSQRAADALGDHDDPEPQRSLHVSETLDGRREISGHLDADSGVVVDAALRLAESPDVDGEPERVPGERRADALVDVCRYFLDHQHVRLGGRHRPHVNVVINADDLATGANATTVDGTLVPPTTARTILCDAAVHRLVTDGRSAVLDLGRSSRSVNAAMWTALVARDRCCRFPGCNRPARFTEAHHVHAWELGGLTRLVNLVLLCSRHHHLVHRVGWRVVLHADATLEVITPDGRRLRSKPPPIGWSPDVSVEERQLCVV